MTSFHQRLRAVRVSVWDNGPSGGSDLEERLAELAEAPLPDGVGRATLAGLRPGPHLAAQREGLVGGNVVPFRRSEQAVPMAVLPPSA